MKAVIVGYGLSGKTFHLPLLRAAGIDVRQVAVSRPRDPDPTTNVSFVDFAAACADQSVDIVVITSPNVLHCDHALAAIDAGKHVVIEKPMATTARDAARIVRAAEMSNRLVTVFHNRRWDGDYLTVKRLLENGRVGAWQIFQSHWGMNKPIPQTRWKDNQDSGGGLLLDFMPHLVDQAISLFGLPDVARLERATQRAGGLGPDFLEISLAYGSRRAFLTTDCFTMGPTPRFRLAGTEGEYRSSGTDSQEADLRAGISPNELAYGHDKTPRQSDFYDLTGDAKQIDLEIGDYVQFYRGFLDAAAGKRLAPVALDEAEQVVGIVDALMCNGRWERR